MLLNINSIHEASPGAKWQQLFDGFWPAYRDWFLSEGPLARPGYVTSKKQLQHHMPELLETYEQLVELAGGGDLAARLLTLYCPPPYLTGCSQAIWRDGPPLLVRNYDYDPRLFEGVLLYSNWLRPVIAMSDCLWGVLDGVNDAGLIVALAFGGRKMTGDGFGVPLVLRYILETCDDTAAARDVLARVPVHMPYNVTVLDSAGEFTTAYLAPDRPPIFDQAQAITNFQEKVEWQDYARLTSSVERKEFLEQCLASETETGEQFIARFQQAPLYNTEFEKGFGTLYTAVYREQQVEFRWPQQQLRQSFANFREGKTVVTLKPARLSFRKRSIK